MGISRGANWSCSVSALDNLRRYLPAQHTPSTSLKETTEEKFETDPQFETTEEQFEIDPHLETTTDTFETAPPQLEATTEFPLSRIEEIPFAFEDGRQQLEKKMLGATKPSNTDWREHT